MKWSLFQSYFKYIKLFAPILVHYHINTSLRPWLLPSFPSNDSYLMVSYIRLFLQEWLLRLGSGIVIISWRLGRLIGSGLVGTPVPRANSQLNPTMDY